MYRRNRSKRFEKKTIAQFKLEMKIGGNSGIMCSFFSSVLKFRKHAGRGRLSTYYKSRSSIKIDGSPKPGGNLPLGWSSNTEFTDCLHSAARFCGLYSGILEASPIIQVTKSDEAGGSAALVLVRYGKRMLCVDLFGLFVIILLNVVDHIVLILFFGGEATPVC